jgi:chorismate mutase
MITFKPLSDWGFHFGSRPVVFAGPCSAETPEQLHITAQQLKLQGVQALRAGIWKPRTRPGSFHGIGDEGLAWLVEAGKETGLPVMTEVAHPKHIDAALKAGVDILWLGARTTVNPFLVQELADVLQGVDVPVLIKNPVNPELELWLGAIERILKTGNERVAAIHRGFSSYENSTYRNKPNWEIPIELRRRLPGIPMFCDPSHICGNTFMLAYVAQFALDLQYDGLMIESHYNPSIALSDAAQQLTPQALGELLASLEVRKPSADNAFELSRLEDLRDQIDEIDGELVNLLANRMNIARLIGKYKFHNGVTILQPERWEEIIKSRTKNGIDQQLSREFILKLYTIIHEESIFHQTQQMAEERKSSEHKLNESAS